MAETRIRFKIQRDGVQVPVTGFTLGGKNSIEAGVELDNESSAWPRGIIVQVEPRAGAKVQIAQIRQRKPGRKPLRFGKERDMIALFGHPDEPMPPGPYRIVVNIGGLRFTSREHFKSARKGRAVTVTLEEVKPGERLQLSRPVDEFDEISRGIIQRSRLDDMPADQWLEQAPHRDRRKVCLLNLLAKLATVPEEDPLNQYVDSIIFSEMDRIYVRAEHGFHESIQGSGAFEMDSVIHPTHHKLKTKLPEGPDLYNLTSYRQDVRQSMQVVVAQHKGDHPWVYADIDIDHGNPGYDLLGAFIHLGQLLDPDKTNHFDFSDDLREAPTGEFLYYNVKSG